MERKVFYTYAEVSKFQPGVGDAIPQIDLKLASAPVPDGITIRAFVHALELLYDGRCFKVHALPEETEVDVRQHAAAACRVPSKES